MFHKKRGTHKAYLTTIAHLLQSDKYESFVIISPSPKTIPAKDYHKRLLHNTLPLLTFATMEHINHLALKRLQSDSIPLQICGGQHSSVVPISIAVRYSP